MKKLLTAIGAALGFAATINAAEVNLRDWLTAKGVDVASRVSGRTTSSSEPSRMSAPIPIRRSRCPALEKATTTGRFSGAFSSGGNFGGAFRRMRSNGD